MSEHCVRHSCAGGIARFLYREGRTFYAEIGGSVFGFVPDNGLTDDAFERALKAAEESDRTVPVDFFKRNAIMTSRPRGVDAARVLSESYVRLRSPERVVFSPRGEIEALCELAYERGLAASRDMKG